MANPPVLDKQLFQMDLSRGLDERARPEVGGDQSKLITQLNNLVQDEMGAWVKRPGQQRLGSATDDLGSAISGSRRVFRSQGGLGLVAGEAELYHYLENRQTFRKKNKLPEFSVTGYLVASSGATAPKTNSGHRILSTASSSKYDVIVYEGGHGATSAGGAVLVAYERDSRTEIVKYALGDLYSNTANTYANIRIAFVADRYLHVWGYNQNLGNLSVFQIDTNSAWPASPPALTAVISPMTSGNLYDIAVTSDRSIVILGGDGLASYTTAGATSTRAVSHSYVSGDVDGSGLLWVTGPDTATGRARVTSYTASNLAAATTHDWVDATYTYVNDAAIAAFDNGRIAVIDCNTATTFGSSTIPTIRYWETASSAATALTLRATFHGWIPMSCPFRTAINGTDRIYVHLCKHDPNTDLSSHVIGCLSDYTSTKWNITGASRTSDHIRQAATLESFNGVRQATLPGPGPGASAGFAAVRQRYFRYNTDYVNAACQFRTVGRSAAFAVFSLKRQDAQCWAPASFGPNTYLSGGSQVLYDGYRAVEQGFCDMPVMDVVDSGGGSGPNGSYNYVAVYRHIDANGAVTYSKTFGPESVTVADNAVTVTVQACAVTSKESGAASDQQVVIDLYRTISGGTQYFLCATSQTAQPAASGIQTLTLQASGFYTVTDSMTDSTLDDMPILYRQPGTANSALDRFQGPGGNGVICSHKDRLFTVDPYGNRVFYTSFFVDGENAWYNSQFSFQVHGGSGPITALASMDGRLYVFRKDAIFIVDGEGPPENGGSGIEFSPPQRLATEFGCLDARSLVVTPEGIVYQSSRGIEILTRSLQTVWVGDKVQNTVASFSTCLGAALDRDSRVRLLMSNGSTTKELVWDISSGLSASVWSTSTYANHPTSVCTAEISGSEKTVQCDASGGVYTLDTATFTDLTTYAPWTLETGFIRPSGAQGRARFRECSVLGKKRTHHRLKLSIDYDFAETYAQTKEWEPSTLSTTLEEVKILPNKEQPLMLRLKIEENQPTDTVTYPITTGQGLDLLGICFEVGVKRGAHDIAAANRG